MRKVSLERNTPAVLGGILPMIVGLVLLSISAYGQETASLLGTVTDQTGAAVPSAKILITNTDTGLVRSTTTNTTGSYAARELSFGHYQVRAEAAGFKAAERTGITLNVNDTFRADMALQVGESKESVTVEANAVQVQADTNEVSQTITACRGCRSGHQRPQRHSIGGVGARRRIHASGFRLPHGSKPEPLHLF